MGERGRPKTPTALIELAGNPGHRAKASLQDEPKPEATLPQCPRGMSGIAKKEWIRITRHLYDLGLVTEIDLMALAVYCDAVQMYIVMRKFIKKQRKYLDANGKEKASQQINGTVLRGEAAYFYGRNSQTQSEYNAMKAAADTILQISKQFGMTPSARSRMTVEKPVKARAIDEFIDD